MSKDDKPIFLYTDGACRGNPGPGGWGVLLRCDGVEKSLYGGDSETTNNRMELMAAIQGLAALSRSCEVTLMTDSKYVLDGITKWIKGWKKNSWKTAAKKPVKNVDLWKQLDELASVHTINWKWVKGHSGHRENDLADALANRGIDEKT